MKTKTKIILGITTVLIIGGPMLIWVNYMRTPGTLDQFATCIADSGTKFYGAFWCPHCQAQKKLFGKSAKLLPYIECSTSDSRGVLKVCTDANVKGYPTWEFPDGSRLTGEVALKTLAEKTSCVLPE